MFPTLPNSTDHLSTRAAVTGYTLARTTGVFYSASFLFFPASDTVQIENFAYARQVFFH